jgi:hypothetical protein
MARPPSNYLDDLAYKGDEFERLEATFDELGDRLSGFLRVPMGAALREALGWDVSRDWLWSASQILHSALKVDALSPEGLEALSADDLMQELLQSPALSDETIEAEIEESSEELSRSILAQWFRVFHKNEDGWDGLALNANMLPRDLSIKDLLAGIDLDDFSIDLPMVTGAVQDFRTSLVMSARGGVIEFGPEVFLVLNARDKHHPFTAYDSHAKALLAFGREAVASAGKWVGEKITNTFANPPRYSPGDQLDNLATFVCEGVFSKSFRPSSSMPKMAGAVLAMSWKDTYEDGAIPMVAFNRARKLLDQSVIMGLDAFSSGMAMGEERAQDKLREESNEITSWLDDYAVMRHIEPDAAKEIFAVLVAKGVCEQFVSPSASPTWSAMDFNNVLQTHYGVSGATADEIVLDARASRRVVG